MCAMRFGRYRFVGIGVSEWRVTDPADSFAHVEWLEQFGVSAAQVPSVRRGREGAGLGSAGQNRALRTAAV